MPRVGMHHDDRHAVGLRHLGLSISSREFVEERYRWASRRLANRNKLSCFDGTTNDPTLYNGVEEARRPGGASSLGGAQRRRWGARISHTCVMANGLALGGDVEQALDSVGVPSYVLDTTGVVRWINPAAERLLGDVRGRHFTSVVAPEDSRRAGELFSQKVLGTSPATDSTGVLVSTAGTRVAVEISSVPLMSGKRVVGVFGLFDGGPDDSPTAPPPHLTPRQVEVLRLLEQGRSTKQIAAELHLSIETVRNHIRRLFRALGVHSRLEAVAAVRAASPD